MSSSYSSPNTITCKAAVAWGPGEALVVEEVKVDPPMAMEIRVRIVCTSICRSDVTQWESKAQPDLFPRIFGHEASGIVESVGEGVTEFEVGDHVLTVFIGECKSCRHCMSGKSNICQKLGLERKGVMHSDQKTRFSIKGRRIYHYCAVSSFSEYTVVHSGCAVKVSPTAPMDRICLLSCGVAAGIGAAWKVADISKGSTVVIFGLGTVGLSVAQAAKLRGASQIIGLDTNPDKYDKGKDFGVTKIINPNECTEPIPQVIKSLTDGGADYSFECVGDTGVVSTALQSCCDGWGLTVTLGVPKVKPEISAHYAWLLSGRTLKGSLFGGWKPKSDLPALIDKYLNKVIKSLTDGGADYSFECVGDTGVVSTALQSCCDGWGLTVTLGVPKVKPEISAHYACLLSGRTLKGSLFGGWKPKSNLPALIDKYLNKEIQVDDLVTHDLPFSSINEAFNLMREGRCLRCVIHMAN